MGTQQQGPQQPPQEETKVESARPQSQQQPEVAQSPSLLDRIVSEAEVARRDAIIVRRAEFDQKQRLAKMFSASGCFQDIDKDEQGNWLPQDVSIARAMVKIELGESMGFSAAESVTGIDIIKGRVAVGASLRGARMQRAGFSWPQMLVTDKGCWMPLCFKGEPMLCPKANEDGTIVAGSDGKPVMVQVVVSFTEKDAKLLGLYDKNQSMYKKDPSSMYFARTITRAQRRYGPGVLGVDILDTYEARDLDVADDSAEVRKVAEKYNIAKPGTKEAAQDVAEQKIRTAEAAAADEKPAANAAPAGADTGNPNPPVEKPTLKQEPNPPVVHVESEKPAETKRSEPETTRPLPVYGDQNIPDPFSMKPGAECLYDDGSGKQVRLHVVETDDGAAWKPMPALADLFPGGGSSDPEPPAGGKRRKFGR